MSNVGKQWAEYRKRIRKNVYIRDEGMCFWCDRYLSYEGSTLDHIIPASKGGHTEYRNLVLSCQECNQERGDKDASAYLVERHLRVHSEAAE